MDFDSARFSLDHQILKNKRNGWGSTFGTTKCKTIDIAEFQKN